MHLPTHILSGWAVANLLPPLTARERLFCMVAATIPDVDGAGYVAGPYFYERYHHVLGHNLTFAVISTVALTAFSTGPGWRRGVAGAAYFALFHLHLLMDYYGSGPGWGISYWWPWRHGPGYGWICPHGWTFFSWQNLLAAGAMLAWAVGIAVVCGRTPLERIAPRLDAQLLGLGRRGRRRTRPAGVAEDGVAAGDGAAAGVGEEKNVAIGEGS